MCARANLDRGGGGGGGGRFCQIWCHHDSMAAIILPPAGRSTGYWPCRQAGPLDRGSLEAAAETSDSYQHRTDNFCFVLGSSCHEVPARALCASLPPGTEFLRACAACDHHGHGHSAYSQRL